MAKAAKQEESNVVELRKNGPAEDAVVALNLGKYQRELDDFASANGRLRATAKHVEAKGINLKAAKRAIAIRKSGKSEEALAEITALFEYLMILGHPIDKKQLDMFRVEEPRTPGVDKAKQHGRYCGIMGLGMGENPYSADSEQGQAWIEAWHGGNEERGIVQQMDEDGDELMKGSDDDVFDEEDEDEGED